MVGLDPYHSATVLNLLKSFFESFFEFFFSF